MSKPARKLFSTDNVELDENRNIREVHKIEKVAYQILNVCEGCVSPIHNELGITSEHSLSYPSGSESEKETSRSTSPEPQPLTSSSSDSESSTLETKVDLTMGRRKKSQQVNNVNSNVFVLSAMFVRSNRFDFTFLSMYCCQLYFILNVVS